MKILKFVSIAFVSLSMSLSSCGNDDLDSFSSYVAEGTKSDINNAEFMATTKDGKILYFKAISPTSCEVTYKSRLSSENKDYIIGSVAVPSYVKYQGETLKVEQIGHGAFNNCSNMSEVILPSTLKTISSSAFMDCNNLTTIEIPDCVSKIENGAFSG